MMPFTENHTVILPSSEPPQPLPVPSALVFISHGLVMFKKKKKSRRHRLDTCNNIIYEFFGFAKPTAYLVRLWYKLIHYKEASGFPRGKVLGAKAKLFGSLFSNTAVSMNSS